MDLDLIDRYLGEGSTPTIDYKKVKDSDWIIYDTGTGKIQKIVKNSTNAVRHFVSSKSAAMNVYKAKKDYAWLFMKKNRGFSELLKTKTNIGK
jgi:hypothetical protein